MGYVPFVFNRYGSREYGCHLCNWWVRADKRRGGAGLRLINEVQFHPLNQACISGINTDVSENIYQRLRWVVVPNIPRLILVLDPDAAASVIASGASTTNVLVKHAWDRYRAVSMRGQSRLQVRELTSFEGLHDLSWDQVYWKRFAPSYMGPAKETAYLSWRYQRIPLFDYRLLLATDGKEVAGLLVFRVEKIKDNQAQVFRLVDFVADDASASVLLHALIDTAVNDGAILVDFFCTNDAVRAMAERCGFVDASSDGGGAYWFPYLFQPVDLTRLRMNCAWWIRNMDLQGPDARNDFVLMKGDYEFDRPN
jgi:hypothetical protein